MEKSFEKQDRPPFRPALRGCVARDVRLAREACECYFHALYRIAANTYRSLMCEGVNRELADLFDEIAIDESEQFRLLGQLVVALGGNPAVHTHLRTEMLELGGGGGERDLHAVRHMVREALRDKKAAIDRCQTLMGHTQDRVVRSFLAHLLSCEQRHVEMLQAKML